MTINLHHRFWNVPQVLDRAWRRLRGFTLLETLVAVSILMLAIVGPLTIAMMGLESSLISSNQITATYLAQDALEYIRATRDSNTLSNNGWLNGLGVCASTDGSVKCYVDTVKDVSQAPPQLCSGTCPILYYYPLTGGSCSNDNAVAGTYNPYDCGTPSKFTRTVSIACDDPANSCVSSHEASTTATVTWTDSTATHTVTLHENLFNWQ